MANFAPAGIIRIGRVPFDNSYKHTMTFANASSQASYFSSVCSQALEDGSYTYVRMNNSIKVAFNAERLYTYNYVMYKNRNYGDKWFYAFITAVNYINERTTELVLELDVMQTWYFDYTLEECFVEREHVNDDGIGAHINPEPNLPLEHRYSGFAAEIFDPIWLVVLTNAYPVYQSISASGGVAVVGSAPVSGGVYQGQYSACRYVVFRLRNTSKIQEVMDDFNEAGCAESICECFTASTQQIAESDIEPLMGKDVHGQPTEIEGVYQLRDGCSVHTVTRPINRPSNLDGYIPRNNKLFTYPYTFAEVGDFTGAVSEYRFEFSGTSDYNIILDIDSPASPEGVAYVAPRSYNGLRANQKAVVPFTLNVGNKVPWTYSAYQNWEAQNAGAMQMALIGSMLNAGASMIPSAGLATPANVVQGLTGVAGEALNIAGQYSRMSRVPNQACGNVNGNARLQNGYLGYYAASKTLRREFAEIVDDFFTCYGYEVDLVKVPNRTGRRNWNYVKCANCDFHGRVPASHMALINQIYQSGITFWHTSDIGNYSLDNSIV